MLQEQLHSIGLGTVQAMTEVKGGEIGRAFRVVTDEGVYFVKYRADLPAQAFLREAEGLALLNSAKALPIPATLYAGSLQGEGGCIVLEWIDTAFPKPETEERLGFGLAHLHRQTSKHKQFGLDTDNYIGTLVQVNGWWDHWIEFYRDCRLWPMIRMADERGLLGSARRTKLVKLLDQLDRYIPACQRPALLHGDLWHGNWLCGPGREPYLIDPAVFYGDREYELAFTELFGGFSPRFYAAYQEAAPLAPGYEERRPLYQLYYVLVHLIHFGESYGPSVDRIVARYVG